MHGLYLTKDLFFASRVTAAARSLGAELRVVGSLEELRQQPDPEACSLALLDLDAPNLNPSEVVAELRQGEGAGPRIIAFGSHIHEDRLDAARQAGCDQVLTRGQFDRQAGEILRSYLSS